MIFNNHHNLEGRHAFLSPSKYYWVDYTFEKLTESYRNMKAVTEGVELHDFARRCIERRIKLPRKKDTLNLYVNDAIKYGLTPEQPLYFSDNCFGTADAIGFDEDTQTLRIFDLKTGSGKTDMRQLKIYAALFFLEYSDNWDVTLHDHDISIILRIYQSKAFREEIAEKDDILRIMGTIVSFDTLIESLKLE